VIVGINSVFALYYYAGIAKAMWMNPAPDGDKAPIKVPASLTAALALSLVATVAFGVSNLATRFGDLATLASHPGVVVCQPDPETNPC
jgi:NADH-quinone oxidoreductase subunit N